MCGAFASAAKENWPIHTVIHMVLATNRTGLMSPIQHFFFIHMVLATNRTGLMSPIQHFFLEIGPKVLFFMSTFGFIIGRTLAKKGI
jgi:hypothetical protein